MARPYLKAGERKRQIVEAAMRLAAEHGVRGITMSLIAAEIGVTTAALYSHFASRKDILLATLEASFEGIFELHRSCTDPDALERLRDICLGHTDFVSRAVTVRMALFEFAAAPPDEGLREVVGAKMLMLVDDLARIVREGQQQGTIRKEIDPLQVAWILWTRGWAEEGTCIMGIGSHWIEERSKLMLEDLLEQIAQSEGEAVAEAAGQVGRPGRVL